MLIRLAEKDDIEEWKTIATEVADLFDCPNMANEESFAKYMKSKIEKSESIVAVDRMTKKLHGVIGFSRKNNSISWFAVKEKSREKGIGYKLIRCAVNQLDWQKDISVVTFQQYDEGGLPARNLYLKMGFVEIENSLLDSDNNNRSLMILKASDNIKGKSFHYNLQKYQIYSKKETCPVCNTDPAPLSQEDIAELDYLWVCGEKKAQGMLFGKCYILPKIHCVNFEDMSKDDMFRFMYEVQMAGKALRKVTGAMKVNYEMHANSAPHLHIHLFPRYLDDSFPSSPIDYRITEPSPYESEDEFNWFISEMRKELQQLINIQSQN